ncbi:MAG: type II toxin-antitoxin system VapC family toxin [Burkholderiales bacterium]|nr:type II toxin-antitoxin system VapC family toxin [Burkholderiales bacterium]
MIAVDSSIIIDVIYSDPDFGESSAMALSDAVDSGQVVICDAALAEVCAYADPIEPLIETLARSGIHFSAVTEQAAIRAGVMQHRFRSRGGSGKERMVSDFLIGAHALIQCGTLITRDVGFYRDYFKGLKIINPTA